jgi:hypothetical protein
MIGTIIGVVIDGVLGIVFIVLGYLVWVKEKITLFHDYHTDNVSPANRKAFCRLSGIGLCVTGVSLVITAVLLALTDSAKSFIAFGVGFAVGLGLIITAGIKYNHG